MSVKELNESLNKLLETEELLFEMAKPFSKDDGLCPPISVNPTEGGHLKYFKVYSRNSVRPKYVARINFLKPEYIDDHKPDDYGAIAKPMTKEMREWVHRFLQETSKTFKLLSTGEYGTHWQQLINFYNTQVPGEIWEQKDTEAYTMNMFDSSKPHLPIDLPYQDYSKLSTSKGK